MNLKKRNQGNDEELVDPENIDKETDDDSKDDEVYQFSALKMKMITNFIIGVFDKVYLFMLNVQTYRITLLEWTLLWKEIRVYCALIQQ